MALLREEYTIFTQEESLQWIERLARPWPRSPLRPPFFLNDRMTRFRRLSLADKYLKNISVHKSQGYRFGARPPGWRQPDRGTHGSRPASAPRPTNRVRPVLRTEGMIFLRLQCAWFESKAALTRKAMCACCRSLALVSRSLSPQEQTAPGLWTRTQVHGLPKLLVSFFSAQSEL
jgi:hypothetical protein